MEKTWKNSGLFCFFCVFLPIFRAEYYVNKLIYSASDPGVFDMPDMETLLLSPTVFSLVPEGLSENEKPTNNSVIPEVVKSDLIRE